MSEHVYEASVFTRTVSYRDLKGNTKTVELHFALDPIQLMEIIAKMPLTKSKSKNPAQAGKEELSDEGMLKFIRDTADRAAGFPSDDGESWEPFEDFGDTIAGKTFVTMLASSDAMRKEFAEKVLIAPFRAFVDFAAQDPSNNKQEVANFQQMLSQFERVLSVDTDPNESVEDRRRRLEADLAALNSSSDN